MLTGCWNGQLCTLQGGEGYCGALVSAAAFQCIQTCRSHHQQVHPCHRTIPAGRSPTDSSMHGCICSAPFFLPQGIARKPLTTNGGMHEDSGSADFRLATGCYKQAAHPPTAACIDAAAMLLTWWEIMVHGFLQTSSCSEPRSRRSKRRTWPSSPQLQSGETVRPLHTSDEHSRLALWELPRVQQAEATASCTAALSVPPPCLQQWGQAVFKLCCSFKFPSSALQTG